MVDARALQVLVGDTDDVGLAIVEVRRKLLVETRRPGQRYPNYARDLTDLETSWAIEVVFDATGPGRWVATFHHFPPTSTSRIQQASLDLDFTVDSADTGGDAALRLRLYRLGRPWDEHHLEHVANVVHADLHGCAAIEVHGHPIPTALYYEIEAATSAAGRLVRHGATLNGLDLDFDPDRSIALDAGWDL